MREFIAEFGDELLHLKIYKGSHKDLYLLKIANKKFKFFNEIEFVEFKVPKKYKGIFSYLKMNFPQFELKEI